MTGIYPLLSTIVARLTLSTLAVVALLSLILFFVFPGQTFYSTPIFIMPKLYASTVYMVLNLQIHIMGGWDTYTASTDISFATDMNITSQSTRGTKSMDRMQGQVSVVAITKVESSDDYEMG